jgi:glycogen debranching enzyme
MLQADLFTGWGMRTLSSKHPAFDPFSYHRGSVWPVEHGSFAMGFMRYGFNDAVNTIARGIFDAARMFDFRRLPEVFSGHQCDNDHPFPGCIPRHVGRRHGQLLQYSPDCNARAISICVFKHADH